MEAVHSSKTELRKLVNSAIVPLSLVIFLWAIKFFELFFHLELFMFGLFPLKSEGLLGILTSGFIHGDWEHLLANSLPLIILGTGLFYFYKDIAFEILLISYLTCNLWVWLFARQSWHIGASGLIYSLAAFLFFSGILKKIPNLMAVSLLVVFLYGSIIWGVLPLKEGISWESHLMGLISGTLLAFYYKGFGTQRNLPEWMYEDDDDEGNNFVSNDTEYLEEKNNP